ncbi:flavin reductase family protein [Phenylobacterium sp.]|jgi:flavin reductase (NADH)/flavin reductase|uniref:flavin reductase family protein n=1 Tax=Phenylobacterium sp. TaxID=1871053 RepID=UPI002F3E5871
MSVDPGDFKQGMRRLGASVCIITTQRPDGSRNGLTATAVCSLSADPPMLLCCLNRASNTFAPIVEAGYFAVSVLSLEDAAVADRFAGTLPAAEKFQLGEWVRQSTGAPVLATAMAAFDCHLDRVLEAGTHGILLGAVRHVTLGHASCQPLLYAQGGYGGFAAELAAMLR